MATKKIRKKAAPTASSKKRFNMEVSSEDLAAYGKAAKAAGLSMSAWVRTTLRKALDR